MIRTVCQRSHANVDLLGNVKVVDFPQAHLSLHQQMDQRVIHAWNFLYKTGFVSRPVHFTGAGEELPIRGGQGEANGRRYHAGGHKPQLFNAGVDWKD